MVCPIQLIKLTVDWLQKKIRNYRHKPETIVKLSEIKICVLHKNPSNRLKNKNAY